MKKSKKIKRKGLEAIQGMKTMRCPYCGGKVHMRSADGIYKKSGSGVQLYVCSNYPECDSYVRVHPGTTIPVGSLANKNLRLLRKTAHEHFDKLHETGLMTKTEAYSWLAFTLNMPKSQAHIGYLSEYYCNIVIAESTKFVKTWFRKIKDNGRLMPVSGGEYYAT